MTININKNYSETFSDKKKKKKKIALHIPKTVRGIGLLFLNKTSLNYQVATSLTQQMYTIHTIIIYMNGVSHKYSTSLQKLYIYIYIYIYISRIQVTCWLRYR